MRPPCSLWPSRSPSPNGQRFFRPFAAQTAHAEKFKNASIQSRRSQYAADMFAATAEIEKGSYGDARNFLREYFPREGLEELRGFEWRYLWQLSAGQQLNIYPINGQVIDMAWSPDGGLMAVASSDRTVKLLRAATGEVMNVFTNNADFNVSVAFSHDGNGLAVAGLRSPVRFWDLFRRGEVLPEGRTNREEEKLIRMVPAPAVGGPGQPKM